MYLSNSVTFEFTGHLDSEVQTKGCLAFARAVKGCCGLRAEGLKGALYVRK